MKMVGTQVAAARTAKNLTQKQLGELVRLDAETIASIEQGRRALMPNVAELMDRHLGLPGLLTVAAHGMPERDPTPAWSDEYMELESRAVAFSWYEVVVLPGLLQTEDYMRALFRGRVPAFVQEEIDTLTSRRLARAELLHRKRPPSLSCVVSEGALRDRIGGNSVYAEQVRHLMACMELPHVTVQVLPLGQTSHPGVSGSFVMLETPEHEHLAYIESQRSSQRIANPADISILTLRYAMLRTQALNAEDTASFLDRLLGEL
ncbi:helix-turn-helix domain-containing protein [Streptomyces sp. H34-S4]|uniref:helix-turn-helix domain-containing protein n=1 Tax=Streptomyces sp. H34-S4 TaxID=2996463 RepID=UPI00226DDADA|nr:helix-turn-helix transcriptional regulator [Streptomyces sp. H34-S4]MCY0936745.1 helix-turn-helix transcriptional regulator [Streptomyces sp. H34-S4]